MHRAWIERRGHDRTNALYRDKRKPRASRRAGRTCCWQRAERIAAGLVLLALQMAYRSVDSAIGSAVRVRGTRRHLRLAVAVSAIGFGVLCGIASASTLRIQGGTIAERSMSAGGACETFDFVDVPITSGVTTYTAYVTDTVLK